MTTASPPATEGGRTRQTARPLLASVERVLWRSPRLGCILELLPSSAWLVLFFLAPLALIAVYSVSFPTEGGGVTLGFTLAQYVHIVSSSYYAHVIWRTLLIALKVTALTLLIGYPVAYAIGLAAPVWRPLLLMCLLVPWWTSILVKNFAWVDILQDHGMVNQLLMAAGLTTHPLKLLYTEFAVDVGLTHLLVPFMTLPLYATLEKLELPLLEAAENLGASPWRAFWEVTLPLSLPGIASGCILTFILAFGAYVTPALLGGSRDWMVTLAIQDQFLQAFNWPLGSALAIVVLLIVFLLVMVFNRLVGLERIWGEVR